MKKTIVVLWALFSFCAAAGAMSEKDVAGITRELQSPDLVTPIMKIAGELLDNPHEAAREVAGVWTDTLVEAGHYEVAERLTVEAIVLVAEDTKLVFDLQKKRVAILLAAGRNADALAQAKALFNFAPMQQTEEALLVVSRCIRAAYPDDPSVLKRFRHEQDPATEAVPAGGSFLQSISIDGHEYREFVKGEDSEEDSSVMAKVNLYLLAGDAERAQAIMEARLTQLLAEGERIAQDIAPRVEEVARCMKARDGIIGTANEYLRNYKY